MENDEGQRLTGILGHILGMGREREWIEVKHNNADPDRIAKYISGLSNAAALDGETRAYMVWGVADDLTVAGTTFQPRRTKYGNEDLIPWLTRVLTPQVPFSFSSFNHSGRPVVLLEVEPAISRPVRYKGDAYIRVDTHLKRLVDHPEHERRLWQVLSKSSFESIAAAVNVSEETVLRQLDFESYFDLRGLPRPVSNSQAIEALEAEGLILKVGLETGWSITNLGALAFARDLTNFESLGRKSPRVVVYEGLSRLTGAHEQVGARGYASAFTGLIRFINTNLPSNEVIGDALRENRPLFPRIAVRELVANALIHQDLGTSGSSPLVEIFKNRTEITNPGAPVVPAERFIDSTGLSRNEKLAGLMRKLGICEERGSGWDKIAESVESYQLPSPLIEVEDGYTRVTLFGPKPLSDMDRAERVRAVYQHACLRHVSGTSTTNTSIRTRFGLPDSASPKASRLIVEALDAGLIATFDPSVGAKARRYLPYWASPSRDR